jgi:hypothetical protein
VAAATTPSGQYWPAVQGVCEAGVAQKEPAAHGSWAVDPVGQYLPALQPTWVLGWLQ